jgi:hypothetical protein
LVTKDGGSLCCFGSVLRRCRHISGNDSSCGERIRPESCRLIWWWARAALERMVRLGGAARALWNPDAPLRARRDSGLAMQTH